MELSTKPILPGSFVVVKDTNSIYRGYRGFDITIYKIIEVSKKNGDSKRFSCDIFIEGLKESSAFGKSHKQAETNAARVLIESFINKGKI